MPDSNLEDPEYSSFAWKRYRRLMVWMVLASLATTVACLFFLRALIGPIPMHMAIATAGGVFFAVLLAAALMGLVFLSSGSGHDDTIVDPFEDDHK